MTDLELIRRAQNRDQHAVEQLLERHRDLATGQTYGLFLLDGDTDDLRQEAMIGLLQAIETYDPARGASFTAFARVVVGRRVRDAVSTSNRGKHLMLTDAARAATNDEGQTAEIVDLLPGRGSDPELRLEQREQIRRLGRIIRVELSPLEARCLLRFANGQTYAEIASAEGCDGGQVDHAICRARWKLAGQGPPSAPETGTPRHDRRVYECPGCGRETVKRKLGGRGRGGFGPGRPPLCNVCRLRLGKAA